MTRRKYSREFRIETVGLVTARGVAVADPLDDPRGHSTRGHCGRHSRDGSAAPDGDRRMTKAGRHNPRDDPSEGAQEERAAEDPAAREPSTERGSGAGFSHCAGNRARLGRAAAHGAENSQPSRTSLTRSASRRSSERVLPRHLGKKACNRAVCASGSQKRLLGDLSLTLD